ncbi:MAG: hypothetical protein ACOCZJ_03905 [Thermoplasmatota archaeon]
MVNLQKYLSQIDQEHYDKWLEGRYSMADLVRDHKMIALMFRGKILNAIDEYTPSEMISILEDERPDIDIKDQKRAVERIECECRDIKDIL